MPTQVTNWETGEAVGNPDGYDLKIISHDEAIKIIGDTDFIANREGHFNVRIQLTFPKGYTKPPPITIRIFCTGKKYDPGKDHQDEEPHEPLPQAQA